ncbi:MAG: hypothetical protein WKF88_09660 [Ferruginibacter sp.]
MKQILSFLLIICCLLKAENSYSQEYANAGTYMDYLSKQQEGITKRYLAYTSASAHGKREKKVETLRGKLMDEIQEARMNISGMPAWQGDKSYRDTAVSFMKFYYNVMNEDYAKIINMEEIAQRSYDEMEAYILLQETVDKKLEEANIRMRKGQQDFAAKNNIKLIETNDEKSDMMKTIGGLNKHYHQVYLIFFKPTIQEEHLTEAIGKSNLTAIEQNKNAMLQYAKEGLEKLKTLKGYDGDNSVIIACMNVLNFYVREAGQAAAINDFFLAKEKFDNIKKDMDKKGSRTKEDVDGYNKAVNEINKASDTYNNALKDMNERRRDVLKDWYRAVKNYFDEHTPHYK